MAKKTVAWVVSKYYTIDIEHESEEVLLHAGLALWTAIEDGSFGPEHYPEPHSEEIETTDACDV